MHGNQWVLKIAVLKYYSVSKRGTTAKSNPKQATDPISLHTKFGDNSSNTFPLNERKPCVTPDIGRRTPDIGHRTAKKAKIIYPPPRGVDIIILTIEVRVQSTKPCVCCILLTEYLLYINETYLSEVRIFLARDSTCSLVWTECQFLHHIHQVSWNATF